MIDATIAELERRYLRSDAPDDLLACEFEENIPPMGARGGMSWAIHRFEFEEEIIEAGTTLEVVIGERGHGCYWPSGTWILRTWTP